MAEKRHREDTSDALDDETWFRLRDAAIAELREHNLRGFLRRVRRTKIQERKKYRRPIVSPRRKTSPYWTHRTRFSRSQILYTFRPAHIKLDSFVERTLGAFSDEMRNDPATFVIRQGALGFFAFRGPDGTMTFETKSKWASDGRAQLSVWIAAWLQQMRYLRAVSADPEGNAWESSEIYKQPINMKMPLIAATKGMWHLYLATDRRDKIVISSLFSIGDTDSLVGIYNLIKSLRILALWVNGPFREFMRTQVLQTSSNAANI